MFRQLQFVSQVVSLHEFVCVCVCLRGPAVLLCVCVCVRWFLCVTWEFPLLLFDLAALVHITYTQRIIPQKGHWFFWFAFGFATFLSFLPLSFITLIAFHFFKHGYSAVCAFLWPAQAEKYLLASFFFCFYFWFVFGTFFGIISAFFFLLHAVRFINTDTHHHTPSHTLTHTDARVKKYTTTKYKLLTISFALVSCCCCCCFCCLALFDFSLGFFSENSTTTRYHVWPRSELDFPRSWVENANIVGENCMGEKSPSGGSRFSSHRTCALRACKWHTFPRPPSPMKWIFRTTATLPLVLFPSPTKRTIYMAHRFKAAGSFPSFPYFFRTLVWSEFRMHYPEDECTGKNLSQCRINLIYIYKS